MARRHLYSVPLLPLSRPPNLIYPPAALGPPLRALRHELYSQGPEPLIYPPSNVGLPLAEKPEYDSHGQGEFSEQLTAPS